MDDNKQRILQQINSYLEERSGRDRRRRNAPAFLHPEMDRRKQGDRRERRA